MNKRVVFLVLIIIIALLLTGCKNPIDIFKSFISGKPTEQDDDQLPNGLENEEDNENLDEDFNDLDISDENTRQITLYYRDVSGYIVPVVRKVNKEEGIAKAALTALVDNLEIRNELKVLGLEPVLPAGIEIELAIKEDGLIRASFSNEILNLGNKKEEEALVSAIVYTLTEFANIDKVQILVNNEIRESLTHGTKVGEPISRGNINNLNNSIEGENEELTLYMYNNPTGQYTYFVPITKNISPSSKNIESALEELISIKDECEGLQLSIPDGTKIFSVNMENGIAHAKFSQHLVQLNNIEDANNLTKAIALTLKEFDGVQGVRLVIDGENPLESDIINIPAFANSF